MFSCLIPLLLCCKHMGYFIEPGDSLRLQELKNIKNKKALQDVIRSLTNCSDQNTQMNTVTQTDVCRAKHFCKCSPAKTIKKPRLGQFTHP